MSINDGGLMDEECQGVFWELCDEGDGERAIAFLDANAEFIDLDCRFELTSGDTVLILAAKQGNFELVRALVERGASISQTNVWGYTALSVACCHGYDEVVRYLIEQCDASVESEDEDGNTPLIWSATHDYVSLTQLLAWEHTANVGHQRTQDGFNALMAAAHYNCYQVVRSLCYGMNHLNDTDYEGQTARDLAVHYDRCSAIIPLLDSVSM